MGQDQPKQQEISPEQRKENMERWGRAIEQAKILQELEKTTPPPQTPPLEEQPTFVADEEKKELDRVA